MNALYCYDLLIHIFRHSSFICKLFFVIRRRLGLRQRKIHQFEEGVWFSRSQSLCTPGCLSASFFSSSDGNSSLCNIVVCHRSLRQPHSLDPRGCGHVCHRSLRLPHSLDPLGCGHVYHRSLRLSHSFDPPACDQARYTLSRVHTGHGKLKL